MSKHRFEIAVLVLSMAILGLAGCGPSAYLRAQTRAGLVQEESVKAQAEASDALIKADWFACNKWSDRATRAAQAVLSWRREVAGGTSGAVAAQGKAEAWADKQLKSMAWHCELARDTAILFKTASEPPPIGVLVQPQPVAPAAPVPGPPAVVVPVPPTPPITPPLPVLGTPIAPVP